MLPAFRLWADYKPATHVLGFRVYFSASFGALDRTKRTVRARRREPAWSVDARTHRQTHGRTDLRRTGSLAYGHGFNDETIRWVHQVRYLSLSQKKSVRRTSHPAPAGRENHLTLFWGSAVAACLFLGFELVEITSGGATKKGTKIVSPVWNNHCSSRRKSLNTLLLCRQWPHLCLHSDCDVWICQPLQRKKS